MNEQEGTAGGDPACALHHLPHMENFRRIMLSGALAVMALPCPWGAAAAGLADGWKGLQGHDLIVAVGRDCRPAGYATGWLGADGLWNLFMQTDGTPDGNGYFDSFSGAVLPPGRNYGFAPEECRPEAIVTVRWWGDCENRRYIENDLYNLMILRNDMCGLRGAYPPGRVSDPDRFDNGIWKIGWGESGGDRMRMWEPPAGIKGDVARLMFYMLAVYGEGIMFEWKDWEPYIVDDKYPYLSEAAARQLLAWHRDDPADERERCRNRLFAARQGNVNPFVEYPSLAEYLWGTEKDKPLTDGSLTPQPPSPDDDGTPLRARYALSDRRINLRSPFVAAGAQWSIGGKVIDGSYLVPADLGAGMHELRFRDESHTGKIMIEIVP